MFFSNQHSIHVCIFSSSTFQLLFYLSISMTTLYIPVATIRAHNILVKFHCNDLTSSVGWSMRVRERKDDRVHAIEQGPTAEEHPYTSNPRLARRASRTVKKKDTCPRPAPLPHPASHTAVRTGAVAYTICYRSGREKSYCIFPALLLSAKSIMNAQKCLPGQSGSSN